MPSLVRQPERPTVIYPKSSTSSKHQTRAVGFFKDPVMSVSRPVTSEESWAAYHFELHASKCAYCRDPYEVHRARDQLCEVGHRLAQDVAALLYNDVDGQTCSTVEEHGKFVRVELPAAYTQVRGLLRAIERSLRHRSRTPFVSMDRTYHVAVRAPQRSRSVKVDQPLKAKSRPRSGEIVDWPAQSKAEIVEVEPARSQIKRGSLYEQDMARLRSNAGKYKVEVREPSRRDLRENRLSGYYR